MYGISLKIYFIPESILTPSGSLMMRNFLALSQE